MSYGDFLISYWNYSKNSNPKKFNLTLFTISLIGGIILFSYIYKITKNPFLSGAIFLLVLIVFNLLLSADEKITGKESES